MRAALICLFLISCAHAPPAPEVSADVAPAACVTQCGLRFEAGRDCAGLQRMETAILTQYAKNVRGWTYDRTCSALRGWRVFVHPFSVEEYGKCERGWPLSDYCAGGYTHHFTGEIEVANADWREEYLRHEIAHVMQIQFREPVGHCDWHKRGIIRSIEAVTGKKHEQPDQECADISEIPRLR